MFFILFNCDVNPYKWSYNFCSRDLIKSFIPIIYVLATATLFLNNLASLFIFENKINFSFKIFILFNKILFLVFLCFCNNKIVFITLAALCAIWDTSLLSNVIFFLSLENKSEEMNENSGMNKLMFSKLL